MLSQWPVVANVLKASVVLLIVNLKFKGGNSLLFSPIFYMIKINSSQYNYKIIKKQFLKKIEIFSFFRNENGDMSMWLVSPQHGRSYVVGKCQNRYVVSKGNGLSYTQNSLLKSLDQEKDIWGLLLYEDALRDFNLGNEINSLGIKTNEMEAIIELDFPIHINKEVIKPILLQYSVECPFRISDAPFISKRQISQYMKEWKKLDKWNCKHFYEIASHILISNLRILHDNKILHNALTSQNLTWALELLDFELASSPRFPYEKEDYKRHVPDLFNREIIFTYQIILDIAWILRERPDYAYLDSLFRDYGFDFQKEFYLL